MAHHWAHMSKSLLYRGAQTWLQRGLTSAEQRKDLSLDLLAVFSRGTSNAAAQTGADAASRTGCTG